MTRIFFYSAVLLLFGGCASLRPAPAATPPLVPPAAYAAPVTLWQQVTVTHGEKTNQYFSLLKIRSDATTLIWFGPLGTRLLSIRWDGNSLHTRGPAKLPPELSPAWLMADVQTVYAPLPALRAALTQSGWQVRQAGPSIRTLSQNGQLQLKADIINSAQGSKVTIRHIQWNMTIAIVSRPITTAEEPVPPEDKPQ